MNENKLYFFIHYPNSIYVSCESKQNYKNNLTPFESLYFFCFTTPLELSKTTKIT